VRQGEIDPPRRVNPSLSPALEAICLKAMALRPAERYPTAQDLAADVERWLADEPITALREPITARAFRWARKNRGRVAALAATAGILIARVVAAVLVDSARRDREAARHQADRETSLRQTADEQKELAEKARTQAVVAQGNAEAAEGRSRRYLYV